MTNGEKFTCALKAAIDGQARVYDYNHKDTFVGLWTMGEDGCPNAFCGNEQPGQGQESGCNLPNARDGQSCSPERVIGKPIVIVWDGRALDGPDTNTLKPHLTPMDWALAFSIRSLTKEKAPECPEVAIHIVDLTDEAHKAWSMRMRHQLLAEMPWVTLHSPLIPEGGYRSGYRPILDGCGSLLEWNGTDWKLRAGTATLKSCASRGKGNNLTELSGQWASTLVQTHDHHDLNNLVGPWILSGITPDTVPSLSAFWSRLDWTGLVPEKLAAYDLKALTMGHLDVLTIDDQLEVGWKHVICRLFGADYTKEETEGCFKLIGSTGDIQLYGSTSARTLLESLKGAFEKRCFDSPIPCSGNKRPWLLALDLLLYPGDSDAEQDWLKELLCIAKGIPTGSSSLAWPKISKEDLTAVTNWLNSGDVEDPAYNTALSLFPRLCTLRWPSVPILLFSGTSRRALTDKLAPYRNIFLAPQKPNLLSGNASEETEAFLIGWRRELVSTKGLIAVQRKLLQLQRQGNTEPASLNCIGNGQVSIAKEEADGSAESKQDVEQQQHDRSVRHLTIALDESGNFKSDRHSAVGGVVIEACSSSEKTAKKLTFDFLERLRQQGVNFYNHPPAYTEIGKKGDVVCDSTITKGSNVSTMIKKVLPEFDNRIRIGAFRCRVSEEAYESSGPPDSTYLKWLVRTLELLLCEYLASKGYELQTTSISLWLPTRNITGDCDSSRATRFDLFSITDKRMVTVGGRSLAYAIVLRSLEGRLGYNILEKAQLKLRKIPYATGKPKDSARDWYCLKCKQFSQGEESKASSCQNKKCNPKESLPADYSVAQHLADACITAKKVFPSNEFGFCNIDPSISFDVDAGRQLEDFLLAGRAFDRGQAFEGFARGFRHDWFLSALRARNNLKAAVGKRVEKECRKYADGITGSEIARLAHILNEQRLRITLSGYRNEKVVTEATEKIFDDCLVDKPYVRNGMTGGGNPCLSFEISETEKAILQPLKEALQNQARINTNPLS